MEGRKVCLIFFKNKRQENYSDDLNSILESIGNESNDNSKANEMSPEAIRWNRFIDEVCYIDKTKLNDTQKNAVLCFWYYAEMNSGGHCGYFDCYPDTVPSELEKALEIVSNTQYAQNYMEAVNHGEEDEYIKTDDIFYSLSPSLDKYLENYIEENKEEIFANL